MYQAPLAALNAAAAVEPYRKRIKDTASALRERRKVVSTSFEDTLWEILGGLKGPVTGSVDLARYREKARPYLQGFLGNMAIHRRRRGLPLTETDLSELQRLLIESGAGSPESPYSDAAPTGPESCFRMLTRASLPKHWSGYAFRRWRDDPVHCQSCNAPLQDWAEAGSAQRVAQLEPAGFDCLLSRGKNGGGPRSTTLQKTCDAGT